MRVAPFRKLKRAQRLSCQIFAYQKLKKFSKGRMTDEKFLSGI
jgi:hypothetical protein